MMVTPMNPNTIEIPTVPSEFKQLRQGSFGFFFNRLISGGCCKTEFNSTYPVHLNGIITQSEFSESISNINRSISARKYFLIVAFLTAIFIIGGIALFIAGGITAATSYSRGFPILIGIGLGVLLLGMVVMMVGCCVIQSRLSSRLQQAIAAESAKYSTRSPTPCSWRLHTSRYAAGGYNNRRVVILYHVSDTNLKKRS